MHLCGYSPTIYAGLFDGPLDCQLVVFGIVIIPNGLEADSFRALGDVLEHFGRNFNVKFRLIPDKELQLVGRVQIFQWHGLELFGRHRQEAVFRRVDVP